VPWLPWERAVRPLVKALHNEKHWVRWEAAKSLSQIASPSSTQALVNALEDNEFDVRWLAAEGLTHIGRPALTSLLTALIKRPQSVWLREGAHHVLHEVDRGSLDKVLKPVMKSLEAPEPTVAVPIAARKALEALR